MTHSRASRGGAAWARPAGAGGGEAPGARGGAPPAVAAGARTEAQTEAFELVAVLAEGRLTLHLDVFATNAPVADAQVEVESGAFRAVADQAAPGVYAVPAVSFGPPGRYPLVVSVQAGDVADLLTATLDVPQPAAVAGQARSWSSWCDAPAMAGGVSALMLAGVGVLVARRRQAPSQAAAAGTGAHA